MRLIKTPRHLTLVSWVSLIVGKLLKLKKNNPFVYYKKLIFKYGEDTKSVLPSSSTLTSKQISKTY